MVLVVSGCDEGCSASFCHNNIVKKSNDAVKKTNTIVQAFKLIFYRYSTSSHSHSIVEGGLDVIS